MSTEEQIKVLERIKDDGNIVLIKFDGERTENQVTVVIDFPPLSDKETIRLEGNDLNILLDSLINTYKSEYGL